MRWLRDSRALVQALVAMLLWRRKNAYKDQYVSQTVRAWDYERRSRNMDAVFSAFGNGGFAPTGRDEKTVPTKDMVRRFSRAFKRLGVPGGVVMTSEYLTTQTCHRCEGRTEEVRVDGSVVRGIRHCSGACGTRGHNGRLVRNRDRNAAVNILKAFVAWLRNEARPRYLTKAGKEEFVVA